MEMQSNLVTAGNIVDKINVTIGPQFLNLFSEQLYSSPNKAFEELVANSWDAGATVVHIGVPEDLTNDHAIVWVLDNGESMDKDGFVDLWSVAATSKPKISPTNGRLQIGKFGIGKLATYVLAHQLTYICKANDGVIRAVTMDYRRIEQETDAKTKLHIDPLPLEIRCLSEADLRDVLQDVSSGDEILKIINSGIPQPINEWLNEYGGEDPVALSPRKTWTLAILSNLKDAGRNMQIGWIRRLLRTTLPLGSSISIVFNDSVIPSSKIEIPIQAEWFIGPGLGIDSIDISEDIGKKGESLRGNTYSVKYGEKPYPYAEIEGIDGRITGRIQLYENKISGGKSDDISHSNGFFINILGRVVNPTDPYFGLQNLNHSAWAKFRATIRFDALNQKIAVNREDILESVELIVFRSFLRALFNKMRSEHDKLVHATWPDAGDILVNAWAAVPLAPIKNIVNERAGSVGGLPEFIEITEEQRDEAITEWQNKVNENPANIVTSVEFETTQTGDSPLVRYNLSERSVLVNSNHPIALEYGETNETQKFLRNIAFIDILTDFYMLDVGVADQLVREIREYRDQLFRTIAQLNRKSGAQIASLLDSASRHDDFRALENITGDAIEYLGFSVRRLAQSGEPEGIATAALPPEPVDQLKIENDKPLSYSFTYDAKSTTKGKAKSGNLTIAGVARHRIKYEADYSLIVAPDFQVAEKLLDECSQNDVTPIRAKDLGRLVMLTAAYGPIDLKKLEPCLKLRNPDDVAGWISNLQSEIREYQNKTPSMTLNILVQALEEIGFEGPNSVHISVIAESIKRITKGRLHPTKNDVSGLIYGLQVLVPNILRKTQDQYVILSVSPKMLVEAIKRQIVIIPKEYQNEIESRLGI